MDYLSIDSDYGTVSKLYKETGKITSPMGELSFEIKDLLPI